MSSEKQIRANRLNGLKGGVKTHVGKAVSMLNALTHGLSARDVLLPGEDPEKLAALRRSVIDDLQPENAIESILVERVISALWRLKRSQRSEQKYTRPPSSESVNPESFIAGGDYRFSSWQNYSRYETALENRFYKALRELEHLRANRHAKPDPAPSSLNPEE